MAPIQSSRSGLTGFLTSTGMSTPRSASATSCMANGLTAVRAPTHKTSTPAFKASKTWSLVATSVATYMPVSSFTLFNHGSPMVPTPSKPPGLVRGFQMPARKMRIPIAANPLAVVKTCSSVSALHGPEITSGRLSSIPGNKIDCKFNSSI